MAFVPVAPYKMELHQDDGGLVAEGVAESVVLALLYYTEVAVDILAVVESVVLALLFCTGVEAVEPLSLEAG